MNFFQIDNENGSGVSSPFSLGYQSVCSLCILRDNTESIPKGKEDKTINLASE